MKNKNKLNLHNAYDKVCVTKSARHSYSTFVDDSINVMKYTKLLNPIQNGAIACDTNTNDADLFIPRLIELNLFLHHPNL